VQRTLIHHEEKPLQSSLVNNKKHVSLTSTYETQVRIMSEGRKEEGREEKKIFIMF